MKLDLSEIEANLAGPKRPQDLIPLSKMKESFKEAMHAPEGNQGFGLEPAEMTKEVTVKFNNGEEATMKPGAVAIAAITSCTNTSNPYVMLGSGLLGEKGC